MCDTKLTTEKILPALPVPLLAWYRQNARDLPWRRTADPYRIWVSEIMLQQTRVAAVLGYYARFLAAFPSVEVLADGSEEQLLKLWEGLGYYSRARNLQKTARIVAERGAFPDTFQDCWPCRASGSTPPAPSPRRPSAPGRRR
jgi:A/G-specific adenine glycosylase